MPDALPMKNAIVVFSRPQRRLCHHARTQFALPCLPAPVKKTNASARRTGAPPAAASTDAERPSSFIRLRRLAPASAAPLSLREKQVLQAAQALPCDGLTPSATMVALVRQGLDLSPSTISYVLQCLERKGALRLTRKR